MTSGCVDLALLVHMYHEVAQPYGLLWNLRPALRPGGRVAVIDARKVTAQHGTPPDLRPSRDPATWTASGINVNCDWVNRI
jgi:hypothetical protein